MGLMARLGGRSNRKVPVEFFNDKTAMGLGDGLITMVGKYEGRFKYGDPQIVFPEVVIEEDEMLVQAFGVIEISTVDYGGRSEKEIGVGALPQGAATPGNLYVMASYDDDGTRYDMVGQDGPQRAKTFYRPDTAQPPQAEPQFGDGLPARYIGWADDTNSVLSAVSSTGRLTIVVQKIKVALP